MIETCIGPSLSKIHSELLTVRVGETVVSAEINHIKAKNPSLF